IADRFKNPAKAYAVIERARGRALADVLRTLPDSASSASEANAAETRTISRLQGRLLKAQVPSERRQIIDALWDAEQRATLRRTQTRISATVGTGRVGLQAIQQN